MRIDIPPVFSMNGGEPAAPNSSENAGIESPGTFLAEIHQICRELHDAEAGSQSDENTQKQSAQGQENILSLLFGAALVCAQVSDAAQPTGSGTSENRAEAADNAPTSGASQPAWADAKSAGGAIAPILSGSQVASGGKPEQVPSDIITTDPGAAATKKSAPEKGGEQSKETSAAEVSAGSTASADEKSLPCVPASPANAGESGIEILSRARIAVSGTDTAKSGGDKSQGSTIPVLESPASQGPARSFAPAVSSDSMCVPVMPRVQAAIIDNGAFSDKGLAGLQAALVSSEVKEAPPGQVPTNQAADSESSPEGWSTMAIGRLIARLEASASAISPAQGSASLEAFSEARIAVFGSEAKSESVGSPSPALSGESTGVPVVPRVQAAITDNRVSAGLQAALVSSAINEPEPGQNKAAESEPFMEAWPGTGTDRLAARLDASPPPSAITSSQAPLDMSESWTRGEQRPVGGHVSFKRTEDSNPSPEGWLETDTPRVARQMDPSVSLSESSSAQVPQQPWGRWTKDEEPQLAAPLKTTGPNRRDVQEGKEVAAAASVPESADKKGMSPLTGKTRDVGQDLDPSRFFKQGLSDARREGTSQLLSGPVASEKREIPVQASAQVSGSRNSEFFLQIAEKFQMLVRNGNGEIHIQLRPENLGRLDIRAEAGANGVLARIVTESSSVKSYLESNLHALQQSFQEQGLKVERIDVLVHEGFDARNPAAHQQHSGNNGSSNPQADSSVVTPAGAQRAAMQDEILVDPMTLVYLGPNSTFHTTA